LHRSPSLHRGVILGLAIALLVVACGGGSSVAGNSAAPSATIAIAAPQDGAQVTIPFDVQLESSVPLGQPESGNHHAHLYFDTNTDSADYDIVYGNAWQVTRELAPGEHTIIVALANPDHGLAGPTQTIKVNVGAGADGSSGSTSLVVAGSGSGPGV
jgi:hypothetical protein